MIKYCVILVAGKNTRLQTGGPKSLLKLNGLSLLERHIRNFSLNGVTHFCVVTGFQPDSIIEVIPLLAKKYGVNIDRVHNDEYELENGFSVWHTRNWLNEKQAKKFILTMGDHAFDEKMIVDFRTKVTSLPDAALYLAVDKPGKSNSHIDLDDVTKVQVNTSGEIMEIGKHISTYNYYDTGMFLLDISVMDIFEKCFSINKHSISDMVNNLVETKQSKIVDVSGYNWNDIDNPEDYSITKKIKID